MMKPIVFVLSIVTSMSVYLLDMKAHSEPNFIISIDETLNGDMERDESDVFNGYLYDTGENQDKDNYIFPYEDQGFDSEGSIQQFFEYFGTGDTAGGNGIFGRAYESFLIEDITETEEWVRHIQPLDEKLQAIGSDLPFTLADIAKGLRWYLLPHELPELDSGTIGVSEMRSCMQQLALQKNGEVWLSERYDKSELALADCGEANIDSHSSRDKAYLLLHEVVVAMYLLKFQDMESICTLMYPTRQKCEISSSELREYYQVYFAPMKSKALDASDYRRVRAVTGWLFHSLSGSQSYNEARLFLYNNGFDPRFFSGGPGLFSRSARPTPTLWSSEQIRDSLNETMFTGKFSKNCFIYDQESKLNPSQTSCTLDSSIREHLSFDKTGLYEWNLELHLAGKQISVQSVINPETQLLPISRRNGLEPAFLAVIPTNTMRRPPAPGEVIYAASPVFNETSSKAEIVGVHLKPYVVTKVEQTLALDELNMYGVSLAVPSHDLAAPIFVGPLEYAPFINLSMSFRRQYWTYIEKKD